MSEHFLSVLKYNIMAKVCPIFNAIKETYSKIGSSVPTWTTVSKLLILFTSVGKFQKHQYMV